MKRGWLSAINRRRVWTVAVETAGRGSSESRRGADEKPKDGFCCSRKQAAAVLSQKCYQTLSPLLLNREKIYSPRNAGFWSCTSLDFDSLHTHFESDNSDSACVEFLSMPICRHCMKQLCKKSGAAVRHEAGSAAELVYVHVAAVILSNKL